MQNDAKQGVAGGIVKLLRHKRLDRGMVLIPEESRCIRKHEIHELVVTDQIDLGTEAKVNRVGFLGFFECFTAGVLEKGDELWIGRRRIGSVVGFDSCHFPNHYNVIVRTPRLVCADDLGIRIGDSLVFMPPAVSRPAHREAPTIIAGFGRAGRMLHLPCILRARQRIFGSDHTEGIFAFDPCLAPSDDNVVATRKHCEWLSDLAEVGRLAGQQPVLHVCSPPSVRSQLIRDAAKLGVQRFVLEKPMAHSDHELESLAELKREYGLQIFVVSNWTASALTRAITERVRRRGAAIARVSIRQFKSRISRSRTNSSHTTVFDVEMPHMVALAHLLVGPGLSLRGAATWDLAMGGERLPHMGGGEMTLEATNGTVVHLHSDHAAPIRGRTVSVEFENGGRLDGFYPCVSSDLYSQLHQYDSAGTLVSCDAFEDDTLTTFFAEVYGYFLRRRVAPVSDFEFNARVCALLNEAKMSSTGLAQSEIQHSRSSYAGYTTDCVLPRGHVVCRDLA